MLHLIWIEHLGEVMVVVLGGSGGGGGESVKWGDDVVTKLWWL